MRAAPALRSLTVKLVLIVASGKTPTTSPSFSARTAASNAAAPALRSTGMCCMARMNRPANQWSKTDDLAMNRTSRCCGSAPRPEEGEVEEADVVAADDRAAGGRHVLGAADVEAEAEQPEDHQGHPDDEPVRPVAPVGDGPNRSRRTTSRQLAVYMRGNLARAAGGRLRGRLRFRRGHARPPRGRRRRDRRRSPGGRGAAGRRRCPGAAAPPGRRLTRCSSPASASAGRTWSSRAATTSAAGAGRPVRGWTRSPVRPGAAGPPGGEPGGPRLRTAGGGVPSRASRAAVSTRPADQAGEGDGVLDPQDDVGGRGPRRSATSPTAGRRSRACPSSRTVPVASTASIEPVVGGGVGEDARSARPRASAARPGTGSWRTRCRAPCQNGEFAVSAVSTGSQTRIRLRTATPSSSSSTRDVHVAAAGEHLAGGEAERVEHAGRTAPPRSATGSTATGEVASAATRAPDGGGGRVGPAPPVPQLGLDLGQASGRPRVPSSICCALSSGTRCAADSGVVPVVLGPVVLLGGLPLAAAGGDLQGLGTERHGPAGGVDDQEFLLDAHGAHPPMIASAGAVPPDGTGRATPSGRPDDRPLSPTVDPAILAGPPVPLLLLVTFRPPRRLPRLLRCRPEGGGVRFGR